MVSFKNFKFLLLLICGSGSANGKTCQKLDACSCRLDNGGVISLHRAAANLDGNPVFQYHYRNMSTTIVYTPCGGSTCGSLHSEDISICIEPNITLGVIQSARFDYHYETDLTLWYTTQDVSGQVINSQVSLQCSQVEAFSLNATAGSIYNFTLQSSCACPGACVTGSSKMAAMSPGTLLILIFFTIMTLYCSLGCIYRKIVHGAIGSDMMPHHNFWFSLPEYIRDGYLFFISPCLGNRAEYRTYDKL